MNASAVDARAVRCLCRARPSQPCRRGGDHLARYLAAEAAGAITRDQLIAVITSLVVIAPNIVITPLTASPPTRAWPSVRRPVRSSELKGIS